MMQRKEGFRVNDDRRQSESEGENVSEKVESTLPLKLKEKMESKDLNFDLFAVYPAPAGASFKL